MPSSTLIVIKPDAVVRNLIGEILILIECHFSIDSMQWVEPEYTLKDSTYWNFYSRQHKSQPYFEDLVWFMISGPSLALIVSRKNDDAIEKWRELIKEIRTKYVLPNRPLCENLVHGSDSKESLEYEAKVLGWD
jgi:nucleoside-diphosphate kinase